MTSRARILSALGKSADAQHEVRSQPGRCDSAHLPPEDPAARRLPEQPQESPTTSRASTARRPMPIGARSPSCERTFRSAPSDRERDGRQHRHRLQGTRQLRRSAAHRFERAVSINEEALGPENPALAASLNEVLGNVLPRVSESTEMPSAGVHERALAIREKVLGPEHPEVAISLNNLGETLAAAGKYDEAEPKYERALAIRREGPRSGKIAGWFDDDEPGGPPRQPVALCRGGGAVRAGAADLREERREHAPGSRLSARGARRHQERRNGAASPRCRRRRRAGASCARGRGARHRRTSATPASCSRRCGAPGAIEPAHARLAQQAAR